MIVETTPTMLRMAERDSVEVTVLDKVITFYADDPKDMEHYRDLVAVCKAALRRVGVEP